MAKENGDMRKFLSLLFILCGLLLAGYPWISNYINERAADGEIQVYEDEVDDLDAEKVEQYLSDAREYNRLLVETKLALIDPFDQTLSDTYSDTPYKYLLDYNGQGIMGFVEIPCINVKLPIYHGTTSEVLEKGVGHQEGSSLPIGGESTHAVLTGHTGLNKAKLFTDLTR
jgi:sortase A